MLLKSGGDYGWPECYYDAVQQKLVLAPEYGGDGGKESGRVREQDPSRGLLPCPLGAKRHGDYDQPQFPARYRDGVFIAFHGLESRALSARRL